MIKMSPIGIDGAVELKYKSKVSSRTERPAKVITLQRAAGCRCRCRDQPSVASVEVGQDKLPRLAAY